MSLARADGQSVLVASSDEVVRGRLLRTIEAADYAAWTATGGADALLKLDQGTCDTLVIDSHLHDLDVKEVVAIVGERHPHLGIFVIDPRSGEVRLAGREAACPAFLSQALSASSGPPLAEAPEAEARAERPAGAEPVEPLAGMVGRSAAAALIYRLARMVAARQTAVLLTGETGTGKELVAHAIHDLSPRRNRPFVVVNCAAIPEALLEAELFGYARGAFTGAFQNRVGLLHSAHGGTLLFDEVGELPASMQVKLLRFLQGGEVQRLGSSDLFRIDVRVIAATNADLLERIRQRLFRQDLYYRLAVFPIELAPLRDRREDIPELAEHCLRQLGEVGRGSKRFSSAALCVLAAHSWPGNVRELQHVVERAVILSQDEAVLLPEHFPALTGHSS